MNRCDSCGEEFEDKFSFCPVDAAPLNSLAAELAGVPDAKQFRPYHP